MRWDAEIKKQKREAKRAVRWLEKVRGRYKKDYMEPLRETTKTVFSPDVQPKLLNKEVTIFDRRFTTNWVKFFMGSAYMLLNERPYTMMMTFFTEGSELRLFERRFDRRNPLFYYFFFIVYKLNFRFLYSTHLTLVDLRYFTYIYFFQDHPNTLTIDHFLKRRFVKLVRFYDSIFNIELTLFFLTTTYIWFLHVFTYNEQLFNNAAKHIGYSFYCAPSTGPDDNGALWAVEPFFYRSIMFRNINIYKIWYARFKRTEYYSTSFVYHMLNFLNTITFHEGFYTAPLLRRRTYQMFWPKTSLYFPYYLYLLMNKFKGFNRRWVRSFGSLKKLHYNRLAFHFEYFGPVFVERFLWKDGRRATSISLYKNPKTTLHFMLEPLTIGDIEGYYQRCPFVISYFYIFGFIDYIDTYFFRDFASDVHPYPVDTMASIYRYLFHDIIEILIAEDDGLYEEQIKSYNWNVYNSYSSLAYNDEPFTYPALSFSDEHWKLHVLRKTRAADLAGMFRSFRVFSGHFLEFRYYITFMNCFQDLALGFLNKKPIQLSNAQAFEARVFLYRYFKFHFALTRCYNTFNHFINNHKWNFFIP